MYAIPSQYGPIVLAFATLLACERPAAQKAQERAQQTVEATGNLAQDVRKDFEHSARLELKRVTEEIARLRLQARISADTRLKERVTLLSAQRDDLQKNIDRLQINSGAAWESLRGGIASALGELQKSYDKASQELRK